MGRIDEALRRSADSVAIATPERADQRQFVSAWTDDEPGDAAPSPSDAFVEAGDSILVADPGAKLPRLNPAWPERLVSAPECRPELVAQFNRLAATLHKAQEANGVRVLMITSPEASEGKTLTAINLALVLSDSYKCRVLLVDADLRRPSLGKMTGVVRSVGLSEALKTMTEQKPPLIPLTPMLTLLPAGVPDPDPISGLTSERMRRILSDAAARFDWVILDAPPVNLFADAHLLAEIVDGTLLVVRAAQTQCVTAQRAVEALGRERMLGVVLNAVERGAIGRYGSYYGSVNASTEVGDRPL